MKIDIWHDRYILQAFWTQSLRKFLFNKINAKFGDKILEVGSGTGALFSDYQHHGFEITGLDLDLERCLYSTSSAESPDIVCGDAYKLPFSSQYFNISVCHYLLLWLQNPALAIHEMARVTKPGGSVIAFAEPDYLSRIDYPAIFTRIGQLQNHSLDFQGINLKMGRQLGEIFRQSALQDVHVGLLAGEWKDPSPEAFENEWNIIAYDLGGLVSVKDIIELKKEAQETWLGGTATVFVPTFYAYGRV